MSWHCSAALVAEFSGASSSAGEQSAQSRLTPTAGACSCSDKTTECCLHSRFGMTCEHLTELPGGERWMSSLRASRASRSVVPDNAKGTKTNAICGRKPSASFARYDPDGRCWKTYQDCFQFATEAGDPTTDESLLTLPTAGWMHGGVLCRLPKLERRISGDGSGFIATPTATANQLCPSMAKHPGCRAIWPTPNTMDHLPQRSDEALARAKTKGGCSNLREVVARFPTMTARDSRTFKGNVPPPGHTGAESLAQTVGGTLNPRWVEWLMGWPIGWVSLEPLGMDKCQQWCDAHGSC